MREQFGLHLFNDFYLRACVTENFMDGALSKWTTDEYDERIEKDGKFVDHFPYADFFVGNVYRGKFIDERACSYEEDIYYPAQRIVYGANWKTPVNDGGHGYGKCTEKGFFRQWNKNGKTNDSWTKNWNKLLQSSQSSDKTNG